MLLFNNLNKQLDFEIGLLFTKCKYKLPAEIAIVQIPTSLIKNIINNHKFAIISGQIFLIVNYKERELLFRF